MRSVQVSIELHVSLADPPANSDGLDVADLADDLEKRAA